MFLLMMIIQKAYHIFWVKIRSAIAITIFVIVVDDDNVVVLVFSKGYRRYLALGFTSFVRT